MQYMKLQRKSILECFSINKTIELLRKLQNTLPRPLLLTIYKSFIRPHLGYGDIIYNAYNAYNASFQQNVERI